jgi:hypothetical protein
LHHFGTDVIGSSSVTDVSSESDQTSSVAKTATANKLTNISLSSGSAQTDNIAAIQRQFRTKGFSKKKSAHSQLEIWNTKRLCFQI